MTEAEAINFLTNHAHGWETYGYEDDTLVVKGQTLTRAIYDVREHEFYELAEALSKYVDPSINAVPSATVVDPLVDDQPATGTWRQIQNRLVRVNANRAPDARGKHFALVQVLGLGLITAADDLDFSIAELIKGSMTPGDDRVADHANNEQQEFVLRWKAIDPEALEGLVENWRDSSEYDDFSESWVRINRPVVNAGQQAYIELNNGPYKLFKCTFEQAPDGTFTAYEYWSNNGNGSSNSLWEMTSSPGSANQGDTTIYLNIAEFEYQDLLDGFETDLNLTGASIQGSGPDGFGKYRIVVRQPNKNTILEPDEGGVAVNPATYTTWRSWTSYHGEVYYINILNPSTAQITNVKASLAAAVGAGFVTSYSERMDAEGDISSLSASCRPTKSSVSSSVGYDGDFELTFPASDGYRAMKVFVTYTGTVSAAETHCLTTPTASYALWPNYRGWRTDIKKIGTNRFRATRVEVK